MGGSFLFLVYFYCEKSPYHTRDYGMGLEVSLLQAFHFFHIRFLSVEQMLSQRDASYHAGGFSTSFSSFLLFTSF